MLARLDEALALIERYQPWRLTHLRRDLARFWVVRYPCRGAYFPDSRTCMTELTFLANPKYAPKVKQTRAGAILVAEPLPTAAPASLISANPYHDHARALGMFYQPPRPQPGIHSQAYIAATARIGEGASIGAFAVVGERVSIGRNAILHPHAVIYEGAQIGDDFCAHSHAVVREH